jgi:putative addiction module CopG family antidote
MARNTQPISITLPHEMAAMVRAKVASGEYASESEVIRDGLRILQARDAIVEKWLQEEIAKLSEEDAEDAGLGLQTDDFEEFLARLRAARRRAAESGRAERAPHHRD